MAITKEKKIEIIKDLEKALQGVKSIVFVNFHKLPVKEVTILRRALREQGVGYKVAKKTLIKRALETIKAEGVRPELGGEVAIAYLPAEAEAKAGGSDILAPAREVYNFQKSHKNAIQILGGVFAGKYLGQEAMLSMAMIPPLETLRGMFVNLINSPIQRFAIALEQIAQKK